MDFSGIHGVALLSTVSRSNWNLEMLVFVEGGKPEYPEENPRSRDDKLNPHMTPRPGIEPGPHWWKASALNHCLIKNGTVRWSTQCNLNTAGQVFK